MTWYVNVDDLVGGWIVTDVDLPMSGIDTRYPDHGVHVICECHFKSDAEWIARLLNEYGLVP